MKYKLSLKNTFFVVLCCLFIITITYQLVLKSKLEGQVSNSIKEHNVGVSKLQGDNLAFEANGAKSLRSSASDDLESKKKYTENLKTEYLLEFKKKYAYKHDESEFLGTEQESQIHDFYQLIVNKSWADLVATYKTLDYGLPIDLAFMSLILKDAPLAVIKQLIEAGAQLNNDSIKQVLHRDLSVVKELINYGLDIHAVFNGSENGLKVDHDTNPKVFEYLLEQGVSLEPVNGALDPLNYTLIHIDEIAGVVGDGNVNESDIEKLYGNYFYYVGKLLEYDAPVDISHKETLASIQTKSSKTYKHLLDFAPNLQI